jgi:uroporphyrinogen decarboxylase
MLHVDFRHVFPRYMGVMPAVPEGCTGVDMWGTGYLTTAACPQHVAYFPWAQVETMEQVAQLHFPTIDDYDFSSIAEHCRRCEPYVVSFGHAGLFDIVNGIGARRRGYEQLLCDILTEDEVAIMLIDRALELDYQIC